MVFALSDQAADATRCHQQFDHRVTTAGLPRHQLLRDHGQQCERQLLPDLRLLGTSGTGRIGLPGSLERLDRDRKDIEITNREPESSQPRGAGHAGIPATPATREVCAPVYSQHDGLSTQVQVGTAEGLKKGSSIHCDDLVSLPKSALTNYVGSLKTAALAGLDVALTVALALD